MFWNNMKKDSTTKKRKMMNNKQFKPINSGDQCSANMRVIRKINTMNHLIKVLATQKSIFWRHRPYPTAFIMHQPMVQLASGIRMGLFWEIEHIPKQKL